MVKTDWEKIAKELEKKIKGRDALIDYYRGIIKETAYELAVTKYNYELSKQDKEQHGDE